MARNRNGNNKRRKIILYLAVITTLCAVGLAFVVVPHVSDLIAFRKEQASLPNLSPFDAHWQELNPDYVGWLSIDGTIVNYPVVRGADNEKYLDTTFGGDKNIVGAIFMDYRNVGENIPHIIIYGHEVKDINGNWLMFGELYRFLEDDYLKEHPVMIFMKNDKIYEYEIFSARIVDVRNPAFNINFNGDDSFQQFLADNGAPPNAEQIITLSTCVGTNDDLRMIVQGALTQIMPITTVYDDETGWRIVEQG